MSAKKAYELTEFDLTMLEILEEDVEREVGTNYERFQIERYGNVLDYGNTEPDESYDERD